MKKLVILLLLAFAFESCGDVRSQSTKTLLPVTEFAEKIKELPGAKIIDVRTPEEFAKGHLQNALNYDWNRDEFTKQIAPLDKTKPVFVYCLSGGRSGAAAKKMRADGFKEVYEMEGGMMKWRAANLPETTDNASVETGMSKEQFDAMLSAEKLVLVDFYADWCVPCKKMKPYLDEIAKDMADKVIVIRINVDENQSLCKELKIDALPVLQVYKNKSLVWTNSGFIEKEEVLKQLK